MFEVSKKVQLRLILEFKVVGKMSIYFGDQE